MAAREAAMRMPSSPFRVGGFPSASAKAQTRRALRHFLLLQALFCLLIVSFSLATKSLAVMVIGGVPLLLVAQGTRRACLLAFYFACACFVIGQRTTWLSAHIRLVPSEIILWGLAFGCLRLKPLPKLAAFSVVPASAVLLCVGAAWGVVMACINSGDPDLAVSYAKEIFLVVPVFFICGRLLSRTEQVHVLVNLLMVECFFLSLFSLMEFLNLMPSFFSGYFQHVEYIGEGNFGRAMSSFWGGPMLSAYVAFCFPLLLSHWSASMSRVQGWLTACSLFLSALCIYFAGHRGIWVPCLLACAYVFFRKGAVRGAIFIVALAIGVNFLPENARSRLAGLSSETMDASTRIRKERAEHAWDLVWESPILGNGLGSSGLVHNDWLQLWADAGVLPVSALLALFLKIGGRLSFLVGNFKNPTWKEYGYGFQSSLICIALVMSSQPFFHLPEQYPPLWTLVALSYWYPALALMERREAAALGARAAENRSDG